MICKRFLGGLILGGLFLVAVCANIASAQCCGTPAVQTFAPAYTTAYAPAPVVWQTYRPNTGWYPGALIDRMRINRWERRNDAVVVTAGYAPSYTVAYAPTFPPSYYATSYRPVTPIGYNVGYAPAVSSCSTCGIDPCGCSREVVMRPICDSCSPCGVACSGCATGCSSCGSSYVGQAVYETSGCSGCAGGSTVTSTYTTPPMQQSPTPVADPTPPPAVDPNAPVREERETRRADEDSVLDPEAAGEKAAPTTPSTMFQAPELYDPANRVTSKPNVPVWTAVYHSSSKTARPISHQVSAPQGKQPTAEEVVRDAQGWSSAGK